MPRFFLRCLPCFPSRRRSQNSATGRFSASLATSPSISPSPAVAIPVRITTTDVRSEFRQSMAEMAAWLGVTAETELEVKVEILSDLLLRYLDLNREQIHGYIFEAYEELLISLTPQF